MQQRKDEILAKRAKLAELKRQRELRQQEFSAEKQSIAEPSELTRLSPSHIEKRRDLDSLIDSLVGEARSSSRAGSPAKSARPSTRAESPQKEGSRSTSALSVERQSQTDVDRLATPPLPRPQTLSVAPSTTAFEFAPAPKPEYISYSKGVQTSPGRTARRKSPESTGNDDDSDDHATPKRQSRRERERDEELRQGIRREIEEELKLLRQPVDGVAHQNGVSQQNFPARPLTDEERNAVTSSEDFLDFVDRSSKVIERALEQEYDVLQDYALRGLTIEDEDEGHASLGKRGRRVREAMHFYSERWSKRRMVTSLNYSPKFPELLLSSYTKNPSDPHDPDGLVLVWNSHMPSRPEYTFHSTSEILTAQFSPYHPNILVGGSYSGQVLIWDTRTKTNQPVQRTPLTGSGHTHPVYSLAIVGTQNANNIISCSTDGTVYSWSVDMLSHPQESLQLTTPPPAKTDELAPTTIAFPATDPTYFLAGTEEGTIYPCHRYDRAGAKAGVDQKRCYRGHTAPVMGLSFHPSKGPIDLGDLVLSCSIDWTVKLWRAGTPAAGSASGTATGGEPTSVSPVMEFVREDLVYDACWSPVRPGVFADVTGAGKLEIWDLNASTEIPVSRVSPGERRGVGGYTPKGLNKLAWDSSEGRRVATGGLSGLVTVFEVGADLGGVAGAKTEEWTGVKKLIARRLMER